MRSIPSTASQARSSSPKSVRIPGAPRSRPQEFTFWPSSVISRTPSLARRVTSATISPGRRLTSRPRTAGTMQYAHLRVAAHRDLHPGLEGPLPVRREPGRERPLGGDPERTPPHALAVRADPVGEVRDRPGPERHVDERVELEEAVALSLGVAAADGDDRVGIPLLQHARVAQVGREARVRLLADGARVEDEHVRILGRRGLAEAERLQRALDALGVVGVHLAPERGHVVAAHDRPS